PFRITRLPARGGPPYLSNLKIFPPLVHVDGQVLRTFAVTGTIEAGNGPCEGLVEIPLADVMKLDPGEHQAGVTINIGPYSRSSFQAGNPPYLYQVRAARPFYVTAQTQSSVRLRYLPAIEAQVEGAISATAAAD